MNPGPKQWRANILCSWRWIHRPKDDNVMFFIHEGEFIAQTMTTWCSFLMKVNPDGDELYYCFFSSSMLIQGSKYGAANIFFLQGESRTYMSTSWHNTIPIFKPSCPPTTTSSLELRIPAQFVYIHIPVHCPKYYLEYSFYQKVIYSWL